MVCAHMRHAAAKHRTQVKRHTRCVKAGGEDAELQIELEMEMDILGSLRRTAAICKPYLVRRRRRPKSKKT